MRKSRTLRHPGVIKVLDTIEVYLAPGDHGAEAYSFTDGAQSLYCHGTSRATQLAGEAEELERGDGQVGVVYCGGTIFLGV